MLDNPPLARPTGVEEVIAARQAPVWYQLYPTDEWSVARALVKRAESGRATIDSLPEVVEGAGGRIPVLVDGGFRRGTDVFKALALGATVVGIGRPYLWGLGAFGQAGVEAVLDILRRELETVMRQAGTLSVAEINRSYVVSR